MRKSKNKILSIKGVSKTSFLYKITLLYNRTYLKYMLYRGKLLYVDDTYRGLGKTEVLLSRAESKFIPVLVGSKQIEKEYKYRKPTVDVYAIKDTKDLMGMRFKNGVLIDESLPLEITEYIQKAYPNAIKIHGGHVPNYNNKY